MMKTKNSNSDFRYSYKLGMFILKRKADESRDSLSGALGEYNLVPDNTPVVLSRKNIVDYIDCLFSDDFNPISERREMTEFLKNNKNMNYKQITEIRYQLDRYAKHFGLSKYLESKRWNKDDE